MPAANETPTLRRCLMPVLPPYREAPLQVHHTDSVARLLVKVRPVVRQVHIVKCVRASALDDETILARAAIQSVN